MGNESQYFKAQAFFYYYIGRKNVVGKRYENQVIEEILNSLNANIMSTYFKFWTYVVEVNFIKKEGIQLECKIKGCV